VPKSRRASWHSHGGIRNCHRLTPRQTPVRCLLMNAEEQVDAVTNEILNCVSRAIQEFDLVTVETVVGILEFIKRDLLDTGVEFEIDLGEDFPEDE